MTTPRTIDQAVSAAAAAVSSQDAATAATINAAAIAALSAGTGRPVVPPAVSGAPDAVQGVPGG